MGNLFEEMGITLEEIVGAAMVFAGFTGAMILFSKYGFAFVQALMG